MARALRASSLVVIVVALSATLSGCAFPRTIRPTPPLSREIRAGLRTIGVAVAGAAKSFEAPSVASRAAQGAAVGSAMTAGGGAAVGLAMGRDGGLLTPLVVVGGILLAPAGAVVGAVHGVVKGPGAEARTAEAAFRRAVERADVSGAIREAAIRAGHNAPQHFVSVSLAGSPYDAVVDARDLDAILEIELLAVEVEQARPRRQAPITVRIGGTDDFELVLTVHARLLRASGGTEYLAHTFQEVAAQWTLAEWIADEAARFQRELRDTAERLADRIVRELFIRD